MPLTRKQKWFLGFLQIGVFISEMDRLENLAKDRLKKTLDRLSPHSITTFSLGLTLL